MTSIDAEEVRNTYDAYIDQWLERVGGVELEQLQSEISEAVREDPQAENAKALQAQLEYKEETQEAAAAQEAAAQAILSEGLTQQQVAAEQAEQTVKEQKRLNAQAISLMKKIPIKKTYLKILNKKDLAETQQTIQSYLSEINKFTEGYFRAGYKPYSFLVENFERGQLPDAKKYYILGVILSKLATINKFPLDFRQKIVDTIRTFNTIFSVRVNPLLSTISSIIQELEEYKTLSEDIKFINQKTKK